MTLFKRILNFLLGKKDKKPAPAPTPAPIVVTPVPTPQPAPTPVIAAIMQDNFSSLDLTKWGISTWVAPCSTPTNKGTFAADHVSIVDGMLCLKLSQTANVDGTVSSVGGEITSVQLFGYGTYEFEAKASSSSNNPAATSMPGAPINGSITGCFSYVTNSETEIDVEVEGNSRSSILQFTSWQFDTKPNQTSQFVPSVAPHASFHKYKYVWTPSDITFFVDGVQVAKHTTVVSSAPAHFIFNHYGTNDPNWGGTATPGVDRFMFVKSFAFTPLK